MSDYAYPSIPVSMLACVDISRFLKYVLRKVGANDCSSQMSAKSVLFLTQKVWKSERVESEFSKLTILYKMEGRNSPWCALYTIIALQSLYSDEYGSEEWGKIEECISWWASRLISILVVTSAPQIKNYRSFPVLYRKRPRPMIKAINTKTRPIAHSKIIQGLLTRALEKQKGLAIFSAR